jgi:hypothetical protein
MANVKLVYGSTTESYWQSTSKITTPSLICTDGTTTNYIPLLAGSAGGTADSGQFRYTLGHLIVGDKRGAVSRVQIKATNSAKITYYYTVTTTKKYLTVCAGRSIYTYTNTYKLYIKVASTTLNTGTFTGAKVTSSGTNVTGTSYVVSKTFTTYDDEPETYTAPAPKSADYKIFVYFKNNGGTSYSASEEVAWSTSAQSVTISKDVVI